MGCNCGSSVVINKPKPVNNDIVPLTTSSNWLWLLVLILVIIGIVVLICVLAFYFSKSKQN